MELNKGEVQYEEILLRDPYSVKQWLNYLSYQQAATAQKRYLIYERAVAVLPTSYKIWKQYLLERTSATSSRSLSDPLYESTNACFERCLVHLNKFPRIWYLYTQFLQQQYLYTRIRHTYDRALAALPITQHQHWVWPHYIDYMSSTPLHQSTSRIYRRYLAINHTQREAYIDWLIRVQQYDQACLQLLHCINDEGFVSIQHKSKHDLWSLFLSTLLAHATDIHSIDVSAVLRSGMIRYSHEAGRLYTALASYYIRCALFSRARDVYEEGINTVQTVCDFSQIFDAYSKYEETMLTMKIRQSQEQEQPDDDDDDDDEDDYDEEDTTSLIVTETDLDLSIMRLEHLLDRRPLLLSSVLLRQNPHNVDEWMRRIALFTEDPIKTIETYSEALLTINPALANGAHTLADLWSAFAAYYLEHDDRENARIIYDKALTIPYKSMAELIQMYITYIEMEMKVGEYSRVRTLLQQACTIPKHHNTHTIYRSAAKPEDVDDAVGADIDGETGGMHKQPVQQRVYRSVRLWSLYADIEENLGTLSTIRAVYDSMFTLHIITPQLVLNYSQILQEHGYHEESYRVYERGLQLFPYPHCLIIWLAYLHQFTQRYAGKKVERTRDLYEQCLTALPVNHRTQVYLLYAKYEEAYGLARRAMDVYDRAVKDAALPQRYPLYLIYIARVIARFGLTYARPIYEAALTAVHASHLIPLILQYIALELKLGEIDRVRALYVYVSQYADTDPQHKQGQRVWRQWEQFEVNHGNEETYREMLRLKRSVSLTFASVSKRQRQGLDGKESTMLMLNGEDEKVEEDELMKVLKEGLLPEEKKSRKRFKRKRREGEQEGAGGGGEEEEEQEEHEQKDERKRRPVAAAASDLLVKDVTSKPESNPEEIELGDLSDEEEEDDEEKHADRPVTKKQHIERELEEAEEAEVLIEKPVPDSVFGL